ncbi:phosphotransferase [Streptomyces sp. NBC_01443]|uniref:phosphotransferase n=1 Tax=Streptomyces sp. NBC_01443 TaxID=2903868 RepID=UPI002253E8D0|nr:phosphotransferase [Streptomyces sp. NBC_01443]MCX4632665.1 phosphotransferase [Streptomyces sp. NBC_01443]
MHYGGARGPFGRCRRRNPHRTRKALTRSRHLSRDLDHCPQPPGAIHLGQDVDGTLFLVMERLHGRDLATVLSDTGHPLDVDLIVEWAGQVCAALEVAHAGDRAPPCTRQRPLWGQHVPVCDDRSVDEEA